MSPPSVPLGANATSEVTAVGFSRDPLDPPVARDLHTQAVASELITIGRFSLLTGLSITTLRHYDEVGLLGPADVDPRTGYRRYRLDQADRAHRIRMLRAVELSPEDIAAVLDGDEASARLVMERHREALLERGMQIDRVVEQLDTYIEGGIEVQGVKDIRVVAINIGVPSEEALETARAFWGAVLGSNLENWNGSSWQIRLGPDDAFSFLNIRVRSTDEAHHDHTAAFGLSVPDLDAVHQRALAAGAEEHYPPMDGENQPRHSLFEDPVGNRCVLWQA
jgi:DNA-binding transcriptional MerR regulator